MCMCRYTHEATGASGGAAGGSGTLGSGLPPAKTRAKSQDELGGWQQLAHPPPIDTRGFDADASAVFKTSMPPQRRLSKDIPPRIRHGGILGAPARRMAGHCLDEMQRMAWISDRNLRDTCPSER